jgi:hypothetical protein
MRSGTWWIAGIWRKKLFHLDNVAFSLWLELAFYFSIIFGSIVRLAGRLSDIVGSSRLYQPAQPSPQIAAATFGLGRRGLLPVGVAVTCRRALDICLSVYG